MATYEELQEAVIAADVDKVKDLVNALLIAGKNPLDIIAEGLGTAMAVVGQMMKTWDLFIPEVLRVAQAMSAGMEILKPVLIDDTSSMYTGKVVLGTVQGDVHNIGKKIVSTILESSGFQVIDIGIDIPADKFVEAVKREKPDILGMSALLTTTMPRMREVIDALKQYKLRDKVRIMVGGAPITQSFADSIGADGYAPNAISAVDKAKQLIGKK